MPPLLKISEEECWCEFQSAPSEKALLTALELVLVPVCPAVRAHFVVSSPWAAEARPEGEEAATLGTGTLLMASGGVQA